MSRKIHLCGSYAPQCRVMGHLKLCTCTRTSSDGQIRWKSLMDMTRDRRNIHATLQDLQCDVCFHHHARYEKWIACMYDMSVSLHTHVVMCARGATLCVPPRSAGPQRARCLTTKPLPAWFMSEEKSSIAFWELLISTRPGETPLQNFPAEEGGEAQECVCVEFTNNHAAPRLRLLVGHGDSQFRSPNQDARTPKECWNQADGPNTQPGEADICS